MSIASGDIPDITEVDLSQLQKLVEADMVEDLTQVYEEYASELTKKILTSTKGIGMSGAKFNGKMMALPQTVSVTDGTQFIWIRNDWLKKVGLPVPQTMDDVWKVAEAFVKQKPSGQEKTTGLVLGKDLIRLLGHRRLVLRLPCLPEELWYGLGRQAGIRLDSAGDEASAREASGNVQGRLDRSGVRRL